MSALLIPLTIAPFTAGTLNPITDALLCATILIHTHIGFQCVSERDLCVVGAKVNLP